VTFGSGVFSLKTHSGRSSPQERLGKVRGSRIRSAGGKREPKGADIHANEEEGRVPVESFKKKKFGKSFEEYIQGRKVVSGNEACAERF